jgi:hypothetical protein
MMIACGCAGPTSSRAIEVQNQSCAVGSKLVCEERHGEVIRCSCKSNDDIRDILDPDVYE